MLRSSSPTSPSVPNETSPESTPGAVATPLVGGPHLVQSVTAPEPREKYAKRLQRSFGPLLRAYAFALRSKIMGGAGDMSGDDQAFFTSTSMQRGVPIKMHDAYINARVFSLADSMQTERSPTLSESGNSFAQYLEKYVYYSHPGK